MSELEKFIEAAASLAAKRRASGSCSLMTDGEYLEKALTILKRQRDGLEGIAATRGYNAAAAVAALTDCERIAKGERL